MPNVLSEESDSNTTKFKHSVEYKHHLKYFKSTKSKKKN